MVDRVCVREKVREREYVREKVRERECKSQRERERKMKLDCPGGNSLNSFFYTYLPTR